jgi:CheY-like chemotaxis protein
MNRGSIQDVDLLIVDDDSTIREIIIGNLSEKFPHLRCREASTGNEALILINERVPDVILLDLRMPGLNGFALTRLVRNRDHTKRVPIIAVTALSDKGSVRKAVESGATDYCVKPIDFEQLSRKIERILTQVLKKTEIETRNRSSPRRRISSHLGAIMPVYYPERDGVWIDSPHEIEEGDPLIFNGSHLFRALRVYVENPFWWSRVDQCHFEDDVYRVKLLFENLPDGYEDQIKVLNRSVDRFRRNFVQGQENLHLEFPSQIQDISGEGVRLVGSLPMQVGSEIDLNLSQLVKELSFLTPDCRVRAAVRWTEREGADYSTGLHFTQIDDDLRTQLMKWCLKAPGPGRWGRN